MDYAMLAPEINSGRLYAGPGSAPMLAAAEAWEKLAAELYSAANSYQAVVSALTAGPWLGPSSASMAAAAASHVTWLNGTAAQVEETATQAKSAVAAYQEAYAAVVPPPAIALNRSVLARLLATNVFGQNTSAIASVEVPVRRDVGPGCCGDVRLRGFVGSCDDADTVRCTPTEH